MNIIEISEVVDYVENNIGAFHNQRIERLKKLKLKYVLKKKNPYLFRAKNMMTAEEIIRAITNAFISSNEETIFGDWLEGLAIYINSKVYNGWKSGIPGIDLEFDNNNIRYIVNIKSGPNWGNSSQLKKMKTDFNLAAKTIRTSNSGINVISINGCCYGKDMNPDKGDYFKYCGQKFWDFISGKPELYQDIIEPLGHKAKHKNSEFEESYSNLINKFTREFTIDFCDSEGKIDWLRLLEYNSGDMIFK